MPEHATISVAMITRNGSAFITEQLESVAAQSRLPDELVISDDGSSDTTVVMCRAFVERAPFAVRILVNDAALGPVQSRSVAIAACTGETIALADQDDVWHPEKLHRMEQSLADAAGPELVFCDGIVVDERRCALGIGLWEAVGFDEERRARVEHGHAFEELLGRNFVSAPATLFRATLARLALPIPHGVFVDAWLALVAAATSGIVAVPERLFEYRQSAGQQVGIGLGRSASARRRLLHDVPLKLLARWQQQAPMDATLRRLETLRSRLLELERTGNPPHLGCLDAVEDRIAHWRLRTNLPGPRRQRTGMIRAELATRRYERYSNGARSALADFVYSVRRSPDQTPAGDSNP